MSRLALTDRAWLGESDREIGVIGVGEPATVPTAAAIANAVANAIGVRVTSIPITPDKVLAALGKLPAAKDPDATRALIDQAFTRVAHAPPAPVTPFFTGRRGRAYA